MVWAPALVPALFLWCNFAGSFSVDHTKTQNLQEELVQLREQAARLQAQSTQLQEQNNEISAQLTQSKERNTEQQRQMENIRMQLQEARNAAVFKSSSQRLWDKEDMYDFCVNLTETPNPRLIIQTNDGLVAGRDLEGGVHFFSIPYAEPPERFMQAYNKLPWDGVLDAQILGKRCIRGRKSTENIQNENNENYKYTPDPNQAENCLFINIYAPSNTTLNTTKPTNPKPVLFWIQGSDTIDPSAFVEEADVIVVTVNSRTGLLGYMASEQIKRVTGATGGMNGVSDLIVALRWVADNIAVFGGDKSKITLGGSGYGSVKACLLSLHDGSGKRFSQLMMHSGSCLGPLSELTTEEGLALTERVLGNLSSMPLTELQQLDLSEFPSLYGFPSLDGYIEKEKGETRVENGVLYYFGQKKGRLFIGANSFDQSPSLSQILDSAISPTPLLTGLKHLSNATLPKIKVSQTQQAEMQGRFLSEVNRVFGNFSAQVFEVYPIDTPWRSWRRLRAHVCVICPTLFTARQFENARADTFLFRYQYNSDPKMVDFAPAMSELANIFLVKDSPFFNEELSKQMVQDWGQFIRGEMLMDGAAVLETDKVTSESNHLVYSARGRTLDYGIYHDCASWQTFQAEQTGKDAMKALCTDVDEMEGAMLSSLE